MARAARKSQLASQDVIDFAHAFIRVPEGSQVGQPLELRPWQQDIIRKIYDQPTRRAIISFGRKNGKTALVSVLILAHLVGPMARRNSQIYSTAQSREQAGLVFALAAKMIRLSPKLNKLVRITDSKKELHCSLTGVIYKALSAEASTAYGLSPVFIVHDELGQVRGPRSELYDAMETATGAQQNPLSVIISTQAPTDADLLSDLIDKALAGHDPRVFCSLYTAPQEADPFAEETIRLANPAFGDFLNPVEVLAMAEDARHSPAREASYRNLILNQRVEASSPFVTPVQWKACAGEVKPFDRDLPLYCGLDLSEVSDLTALVQIGRMDGIWHVKPTFWLPNEGLAEKSRSDRVPYDLWRDQGHLLTCPGKSVDYEFVAQFLKAEFDQYNIVKVAFDRWNMKHLKPWLLHVGFSETLIEQKFVEFGQGTQSMSPALRELEAEIRNARLRHGDHPVLRMCAANAVVDGQDSASRKLSKKKSSGRIDGMVALAMAMGSAASENTPDPTYQMIFV